MSNISTDDSYIEVLKLFKENIMKSVCVSEIGIVTKRYDDIAECQLLNDRDLIIPCFCTRNDLVEVNDIVIILFTDSDFRENLKRFNANQTNSLKKNTIFHSKNYGIVIRKLYSSSAPSQDGVLDVLQNGNSVVYDRIAYIDLSAYVLASALSAVATSGSYTDLINKPTIPTKTSDLTNDGGTMPSTGDPYTTKSFVNSSIATNTAYFRGTYNIVTDLHLNISATEQEIADALAIQMSSQSIDPTNNDYCFVSYHDATDPTQIDKYDRYKYNSSNLSWEYEFTLNNSSFTAAQWAAINSGITDSNWVTIDTEQTISGKKTFTGDIDTSLCSLQLKIIKALTSSSSTTYGPGTAGQVLKSNGSNVYWASDTSNNNAYYLQAYYFSPSAAGEAIYRYKLVALDKDNRVVPITITDQSNTTMVEKTPTSVAFKPWKIFQYNTTATIAAGGAFASHTLQESYNSNPVYNFNTTISAKRLVYLCGTYDRTTGLFTLDTTVTGTNQYRNYYTQVPTNTANITLSSYFTSGKDYILVGGNYGSNTSNLQLFVCNPMYHFDGTNLIPYETYNENRIENNINNGTLTLQLNGSTVQTFTANQSANATANIQALPNFSLNISHGTAGNPRQVKFLTIDYNTKATYFKMSATSCHDNGTSYQFLEDIIIGCTTGGVVVCNVYKYCQASVTLDGVSRNYGDVFYVIDTTNKRVDFYILCGQYASSQFTPATKIGNTTIQYITQYTGTATYYSSGTKVWANGNSTTYARLSDIPSATGDEAATSSTIAKRDSSANLNATSFSMCASGTSTLNAKIQYNSTNESIEFIFS